MCAAQFRILGADPNRIGRRPPAAAIAAQAYMAAANCSPPAPPLVTT
jgi:hypothetical protein